ANHIGQLSRGWTRHRHCLKRGQLAALARFVFYLAALIATAASGSVSTAIIATGNLAAIISAATAVVSTATSGAAGRNDISAVTAPAAIISTAASASIAAASA